MRSKQEKDNIQILDEWYHSRCNGEWEHRFGVDISTCDNPGWTVTFSDLPLPADPLAKLLDSIRREEGAEVIIEGAHVRIYSRSLRTSLSAATKLIGISRQRE